MLKIQNGLTKKEREKVVIWISERKKAEHEIICSICKNEHWSVAEHLVVPLTVAQGLIQIGKGPTYPMAMITCNKCGHTLFLNAVKVGLLPKKEETQKDPKTKGDTNG